ncbi:LPS export ABC transporter periplasmic protein LptC, partial [bacterium]
MTGAFDRLRQLSFGLFIGLLVAFLGLSFFFDVDKYIKRQEESFSIDGSYIRITKKGKLKWEVWTEKIVVSREGTMHKLKNIEKGYFYRKDKPPFEFHANGGIYNSSTDEIHLKGDIEFDSVNGDYFMSQELDWFGKSERLEIPVLLFMRLDGNTYNAGEMVATGEDLEDVTLTKDVVIEIPDAEESASDKDREEIEESGVDKKLLKKLVLQAQRVEYEGEPKKFMRCFPEREWKAIHVPGEEPKDRDKKVVLNGESFTLKSREMYMDFKKKYAYVVGDVWILRKAEPDPDPDLSRISRALRKRDTTIETDEAYYYWKEGHVRIPGPLEMFQENLDLNAGRGFMDSKRDTMFLSEGVNMHQEEGSWIIEEGLIDEDAGEEKRETVKEKTDVVCEMLDMNFETEDMSARGDVEVLQEKKTLYGTAAVYDSESGMWTVYGNPVYQDKEEGRITAETFLYQEEEGIFDALGDTNSEVEVGEEHEEDIEEFYRDRDGREPLLGGDRRAAVFSYNLKYDEEADVAYAMEGARIVFRDLEITADKAVIDYSSDTASGTGHVIITDPYTLIMSDRIYVDGENDKVELYGNVFLEDFGHPETDDRDETEPFTLETDYLEYYRDTRMAHGRGNVALKSADGERWVTSEELDMDRGRERYVFTGDVRYHQESGEWLEAQGFLDADNEDDDRARAVAKNPTDITCRRAVVNDGQNTVRFEGEVMIKQPEKKMRADIVEVDARAKRLSADGNVYLEQTSGAWLFEDGFVDEDEDDDVKDRLRNQIQVKAGSLESMYGERKL